MTAAPSFEQQKRNRLLDNFIDDIFPIKKYLDDPAVTDICNRSRGIPIYSVPLISYHHI
jgi:hypothetical protein